MANKYNFTPEEKKMIRKAWLNSFNTPTGSSVVVRQGKCFGMAVQPAIDLFYKTDEEKAKAFYRESLEYFNTHQMMINLIIGICMAMEKKNAESDEDLGETISSLKASLQGPAAGIGDSLDFNVLRVIYASIAIGLSTNGSLFGPFLYLLVYGLTYFGSKYLFTILGYRYGQSVLTDIYDSGIMPKITEAASILGCIMVGSVISTNVKVTVKLAPVINGLTLNVQGLFDTIMPGCLKMIVFWIIFAALGKKKMTILKITWITMGVCVLLAAVGIF